MTVIAVVSIFAATLSMISFIPQAWTIIRTRSTEGISLKMYFVTVAGFICWLIYGVLLVAWPIIIQNLICLAFSTFILTMKLLPQKKVEAVADTLTPDALAESDAASGHPPGVALNNHPERMV